MSFSFMIPLTTVLVAVYLFRRSSDEMAYLCGSIAVVGLLLSLVLAPWQLQLLLLIFVVLSTRKLWQQTQIEVEPESEKKTTLLYRGSNYEAISPTTELTEFNEVEIEKKYRGQVCQSLQTEDVPVVQQTFQLKYRGATVDCQKPVIPLDKETANSEGEEGKTN